MTRLIAKNQWLTARRCLTEGWFSFRETPPVPSEADRFRMKQGREIGALARKLFPHGALACNSEGKSAGEISRELLTDTSQSVLFEPTVEVGQFVARPDIIERMGNGWRVLEVKSSFEDTNKICSLVDDLAYTVMVMRRYGLQVASASLMLLSRLYRFGGSAQDLFVFVDKSSEVNDRAREFEAGADSVAKALLGDTPPAASLVSECRNCGHFPQKCLGRGIAHTVFDLPALHASKIKQMSVKGIIDLRSVPPSLKLSENQARARKACLSGVPVVEPSLKSALQAIAWPCSYLDFETAATAMPLYDGHHCHQQVLTQFSIHRRETLDAEPVHGEYLADAARDCQRDLAQSLIDRLGDRGSIIVYSSFEKTRISGLCMMFPDLAAELSTLIGRLVDLLAVVRGHVYYPLFRGSYSIKTVLPAMIPDLSYAGLDIADGETAITRFAKMARGEIVGDDVATTRRQLLEYCKQDTLAMVRLHEALVRLAA